MLFKFRDMILEVYFFLLFFLENFWSVLFIDGIFFFFIISFLLIVVMFVLGVLGEVVIFI